jgi:hypothetical protein
MDFSVRGNGLDLGRPFVRECQRIIDLNAGVSFMKRCFLGSFLAALLLGHLAACTQSPSTSAEDTDPSEDTTAPSDSTESQDTGSLESPSDTESLGETASEEPVETVPEDCESGVEAACAAVSPGYPSGTAVCGEDGAWDVSECWYGDTYTEQDGWIDPAPAVKIGYLLNGARMEDQLYIIKNQTRVLPKAVFRGEHLGKTFPPGGISLTYGWRVDLGQGEPGILVLQMTNQGITPQSPMVQMLFLTDKLEPGDYLVGQNVVASLINVDPKTESQCVAGVAYGGAVRVTEAKDTHKVEGGSFSFALPHEIHLYAPSNTTFGDLTGTFEGIEACP